MAIGIPVKMVVLTIVGMAGLGAMFTIIDSSEHTIPKQMHADIKSSNFISLSAFNETADIEILVEVFDSRDAKPLKRASVILAGMGTAAVNVTDRSGCALLRFKKTEFDLMVREGFLKLDIKADGFQDYSNEYALKIVR